MQIRLAAEADIPALKRLYDERLAMLVQADRRIKPETVDWLARDGSPIWVGEVEGVVGGYVSARRTGDAVEITHIALDAHVYHPGLARQLVAAVREWAREIGAAHITIRVPVNHLVEQAFWLSIGAQRGSFAAPGYEWMQLPL